MESSHVIEAWSEARRVAEQLPYNAGGGPSLQSLFLIAYAERQAPSRPKASVERTRHHEMPQAFADAAERLIDFQGSNGATAGQVIRASGGQDAGIHACQVAGGWLRDLGYTAWKSNGRQVFRKRAGVTP